MQPQSSHTDTHFVPPHPLTGDWSKFYKTVREVAASPCPTPGKSSFMFELSEEAAIHNSNIIASFDYDLEQAINSDGFSHLSMGSELRPIHQLEALLKHHPYFPELKEIAAKGANYPLRDITEEVRTQQLELQLKQGNQDTALTDEALPIVTKLLLDDINSGFSIVVTIDCLKKLKHAEVYPYGLIHQTSIDEKGNPIPKKRLKHNLSVRKKSGLAINQRTIMEELTDTQYGFALSRHLHKIHAIRFNNPGQRILCNKVDIDKAFRRLHTTPEISAKCCSTWKTHTVDKDGNLTQKSDTEVGTILTRLPFGASAAPAKFSILSEISFDLANDLIHCDEWDTDELVPPLHEQIPQPSRLDDEVPFGIALPVDVDHPPDTKAGSDGYVDDGTNAVLDSLDNIKMVKRTRLCNLMALFLLCRPHVGEDEPISRSQIASIRKLLAEGGLAEIYVFLGWLINTRTFTIALPREKWTAWLKTIVKVLNSDHVSFDEISTLVGRLEHVCYIIPAARHFMNRLRFTQSLADNFKTAKLSDEVKLDLKLWIKFLTKAHDGISINNVVFRSPTSIPLTDASESGIGGYSLQHNALWRYEFTPDEQRSFTLNTKEYIAAVIGAYIALLNDPCKYPCVLSLSDSSSTVSWLHKSNHDPFSLPIHNEIARWHAENLLEHEASDYSQHIAGSENHVADSLSRNLPTQSSFFMDWLSSAKTAQEKGTGMSSQAKYNSYWRSWLEFLQRSDITDPYIEHYTPYDRSQILCAFMDAYRNGVFSQKDSVKGKTAGSAAEHVATIIRESGRPDPRISNYGHTFLNFKRQKTSYARKDPPTKHQKALPPIVYRTIIRSSTQPRETARAITLGAALFFCMRSCEYSKTPRDEEQKTRPIRPCDITFRLNGNIITHDHPNLHLASTVSITFGPQKSEVLEETVNQYKSDDELLCPCKLWASVIKRLRSYPNYDPKWPVYTFFDGSRFTYLSSHEYSNDIKAAVDAIGENTLGFTSHDVGTHSNRAGGAMMMYLSKPQPLASTIMMIGRWKSLAFLKYIEKQVIEFSEGLSKNMLQKDVFFNAPANSTAATRKKRHRKLFTASQIANSSR